MNSKLCRKKKRSFVKKSFEWCKGTHNVEISKNAENAPTLAIVAVHSAENEPLKVLKSSKDYALEIEISIVYFFCIFELSGARSRLYGQVARVGAFFSICRDLQNLQA